MLTEDLVVTPRLELRLLSRRTLRALAEERWGDVDDLLPFGVSVEELRRLGWVAGIRDRQLEDDPSAAPWLLRGMRLRTPGGAMVGHIGLHGPPDADGVVEIGYTVFEAQRRQGYAEEAVRGLLRWAGDRPGVRTVRASVGPDNAASLALVAKLGLVETGRQWDDEDGEEIVFERSLPL